MVAACRDVHWSAHHLDVVLALPKFDEFVLSTKSAGFLFASHTTTPTFSQSSHGVY